MMKAQDYLSAQPEMITKSFKVTGISLALDGSEDHLLRNKDILQLVEISEDEENDEEEDPFDSDRDTESTSEDESDC